MTLSQFLIETLLISLSGVMAPGPMTTITIGRGNKSPHAGALVSIGHGLVEFPLMILIFFGFGFFFSILYVKAGIAFIGGIFLLIMGIGLLRSMNSDTASGDNTHSSVVAGMLLSIGNPYFLIWWATVGAALTIRSATYGFSGFTLFAFTHWLCDFIWLYILSVLSYKGGQFFGKSFQKIVFAVCGILLIFFSGKFIYDAVSMIIS